MNACALMSLLSATAANLVALVFLRALWHKMRDIESFAALTAEYRLLPKWTVDVAARIIVACEASAVLALSVPTLERSGSAIAVTMFLFYGAAMTSNMLMGRTDIDCGCGSPARGLTWQMVIRNLALAGIAALPLVSRGKSLLSADERVLTAAAAIPFFLCFVLVEQILVNSARKVAAARRRIGALRAAIL